jgi:propionyl-CoA synthetase
MGTYADFHKRSIEKRDEFWAEEAKLIDWQTPPQQICDFSRPPFSKWFVGGKTNLCHNAVDRHAAKRPNDRALVYISTETNEEKSYTFAELKRGGRCARRRSPVAWRGRGDRVLIYMPMIAEATFAILACARIGAIHSVVFGGFASGSLATRIDDAKPKLIVSSDAGMRGGKAVPYKHLLDEACKLAEFPPPRC